MTLFASWMRRVIGLFLFLSYLLLSTATSLVAQVTLSGQLRDERDRRPVPGASVSVPGAATVSEADGSFELVFTPAGERVVLTVSREGFADHETEVALQEGQTTISLGSINLTARENPEDILGEDLIPVITLAGDEATATGTQNVSGVLTASRDVFVSAAAFVFGPARFDIRGYDSDYSTVTLNGLPVNDLESGQVFWSNWGGLNDVLRNRTNSIGLAPVPFAFGGIGGASDIDLRASRQWKQLRVSYARSNRTYNNRVMATYNTGLLDNGWAFSLSASRRWAQEAYIPGTFYDAYSYFASIDKVLNDRHALNLVAFGSPIKRGKSTAATQEMYDLAGTNYYNANWGYQHGEKRNARIANINQPMLLLRHDWQLSNRASLRTTAGYQFGRTGDTALDWYNAPDPRPDYYRRLPSYIDNEQAEAVAAKLRADEAARQIDWDRLYAINRNSLTTIRDADGLAGNDVTGLRAQYIVEERRSDSRRFSFGSVLETFLTERVTLHAGLNWQQQTIANFKVVDDLLDADFYVDIDKFAEFDSSANLAFIQNDISTPNRLVREGDRFGYDYDFHVRQGQVWGQVDVRLSRFDLFAALQVGNTRFWRDGQVANGKFPDGSLGESGRKSFLEYGLKGGATLKVDGRNYFLLHAAYLQRAPYVEDAFTSPRTRNQLVTDPSTEKMLSLEGGYLLRAPNIKARAIGYFTRFRDKFFNRSFYLDNAIRTEDGTRGGFVNYIMRGVNTEHLGAELAAEVKVSPTIKVSAVAAVGQYIYTNRPQVTAYLDNVAQEISEHTVYIQNFKVAGTPQSAYTLGLNYNSPKYWFVNVNFNYFDRLFIDFYPERRTVEAVAEVAQDSEAWRDILYQEQAPSAFTVDLFGGKSWKLKDGMFLYLNVGVSNLLDKQDFITGGYEQLRFDFEGRDVDRFPNRYFHGFGRNYFINLALRL